MMYLHLIVLNQLVEEKNHEEASLTENNTAKIYFIVLSMNPESSRIYIRNGNEING